MVHEGTGLLRVTLVPSWSPRSCRLAPAPRLGNGRNPLPSLPAPEQLGRGERGQERGAWNNSAAAEAPMGMARQAWGPGAGSCFHHGDGEMPLLRHTVSLAAKCIYRRLPLPCVDTQGGAENRGDIAVVSLSCPLQMGSRCRPGSRGNPLLPQLAENIPLQPRHEKSTTGQMLGRILATASRTLQHCLASWKPGPAAGVSDLAGKEPSHWAQAKLRCPP